MKERNITELRQARDAARCQIHEAARLREEVFSGYQLEVVRELLVKLQRDIEVELLDRLANLRVSWVCTNLA
jgi:hypothetical protein